VRLAKQGTVNIHKTQNTYIPDSESRLLLRWWLGIPILPQGTALPECPLCKDTLDPYEDHFVCCKRNGSSQRHHAFRDAFFAVCAQHNVAVVKEAECLASRRPADILFMNWSRGRHVAVDFVCTHPAGVAQHPLVVEHCNQAETQKVHACIIMWGPVYQFRGHLYAFLPSDQRMTGFLGRCRYRRVKQCT